MSDDLMCQDTDSAKGDASDAQERATSLGAEPDAVKSLTMLPVTDEMVKWAERVFDAINDQEKLALLKVLSGADAGGANAAAWAPDDCGHLGDGCCIECAKAQFAFEASMLSQDEVGALAPSDVSHPDVPTLDTIKSDFAEAIRLLHSYAYPGPTAYSLKREQSARDFIKKYGGSDV